MPRRTTIADIAKELNITAATVSRALSNHPEISASTKVLVRETAERMGYNRNKVATALRSGRTNVIGVMIPTAEHFFFGSLIHGLSNLASENGYDLLIYQSNESEQFEKKGIDTFIGARVDGILVSIAQSTTDFSHFIHAKESGVPIAFFDRFNDELDIPSVSINDYQAAYAATESLIRSGYKKIAHISGPEAIRTFAERIRGYKDALEAYGFPFRPEWLHQGAVSLDAGRDGISYLLELTEPPDAVLAVEDTAALGALKELKRRRIAVPESFGVFGFSNEIFSEHISPSLSTVDQQTVQMGMDAFWLIQELIENKDGHPVESKVLEPVLLVRESSQKYLRNAAALDDDDVEEA